MHNLALLVSISPVVVVAVVEEHARILPLWILKHYKKGRSEKSWKPSSVISPTTRQGAQGEGRVMSPSTLKTLSWLPTSLEWGYKSIIYTKKKKKKREVI